MIEFLTENWKLFTILGAILVDLVLVLVFKKRVLIYDNSFYMKVSAWIYEAEQKFEVGSDKLSYVMDKAKEYLGSNFNAKSVREVIEWILTLPEKKEKK